MNRLREALNGSNCQLRPLARCRFTPGSNVPCFRVFVQHPAATGLRADVLSPVTEPPLGQAPVASVADTHPAIDGARPSAFTAGRFLEPTALNEVSGDMKLIEWATT